MKLRRRRPHCLIRQRIAIAPALAIGIKVAVVLSFMAEIRRINAHASLH